MPPINGLTAKQWQDKAERAERRSAALSREIDNKKIENDNLNEENLSLLRRVDYLASKSAKSLKPEIIILIFLASMIGAMIGAQLGMR